MNRRPGDKESGLSGRVRGIHKRLTPVWIVAISVATYVIVWLTAAQRLWTPGIVAKARVAATMVMPTTGPSETVDRWKRLGDDGLLTGMTFHPADKMSASQTEMRDGLLRTAAALAATPDSAPDFPSKVAAFNVFAAGLNQTTGGEPWYERFLGEHAYRGCGVGFSSPTPSSLRSSASIYLQYADSLVDVFPFAPPSPTAMAGATRPTTPQAIKSARSRLIRSVPLSVVTQPWRLFEFYDPDFAALCDGIPKSVLFILLAFHFFSDLHFCSVGSGGLFAAAGRVPLPVERRLLRVSITIIIVILCAEGRDVAMEVARLLPMIIVVIVGGGLAYCLLAMTRAPLSLEFITADLKYRRRRLVPFAIGGVCLIAGCLWGIYYSAVYLIPRCDLGSVGRGVFQAGTLLWVIALVCRLARRLLLDGLDRGSESASAAAPPTVNGQVASEMVKALALLLSPVLVQTLKWFTEA